MTDPVQLIVAITGLLASIFICFKTFKSVKTPCFSVEIEPGTQQEVDLISYIVHRVTPRSKKDKTAKPSDPPDIEQQDDDQVGPSGV